MVFPLAVLHPRCEVAHFTIISVIREPHLGADKDNFFVMYDDPAVVNYILVYNRPKKIVATEKIRDPCRSAYIPKSQMMPMVSSDDKIFAKTSHE